MNVKQLYTAYPYPAYNEFMDKFAPVPHQFSDNIFLEQIRHYIYQGNKSFDNYRVLVAGVGLGTDIINMAYLLREHENCSLLGIDVSQPSLDICKQRLLKYDAKNVELINMSLLHLDPKTHGVFDLIICAGVLHHLKSPKKGLSVLKEVLKEDGCMSLMVYAKYGRTGIYNMQDLLKKINHDTVDYESKIQNFKIIHAQLPKDNWFKLGEHMIHDHKHSDAGIVDMLLHCQDTSYSVPSLYAWSEAVGLNIVEFAPRERYKYKHKISGITYPAGEKEQYAINELFFGDINKHIFYVAKNSGTKASLDNLDNVLILVLLSKADLEQILIFFKTTGAGMNLNTTLNYPLEKEHTWTFVTKFANVQLELNDIVYHILRNLDGTKSLKQLFQIARKAASVSHSDSEILEIFRPTYEAFEMYDMVLLKSG